MPHASPIPWNMNLPNMIIATLFITVATWWEGSTTNPLLPNSSPPPRSKWAGNPLDMPPSFPVWEWE